MYAQLGVTATANLPPDPVMWPISMKVACTELQYIAKE